MALTRKSLAAQGCEVPGCAHAHDIGAPLALNSRCHPGVGAECIYSKDGVLTIRCRECKKMIAELLIAGGTDREELAQLIQRVENVVPYVTATLGVPGLASAVETKDPEWKAVHIGRANSSYQQLSNLLDLAKKLKPS
jgi:hypothetical protein